MTIYRLEFNEDSLSTKPYEVRVEDEGRSYTLKFADYPSKEDVQAELDLIKAEELALIEAQNGTGTTE